MQIFSTNLAQQIRDEPCSIGPPGSSVSDLGPSPENYTICLDLRRDSLDLNDDKLGRIGRGNAYDNVDNPEVDLFLSSRFCTASLKL